jgi:hypothetical protein
VAIEIGRLEVEVEV